MGLGGYLTWTAAFHEIHKATGRRCVPGEQYATGFITKNSQIFYNNPSVVFDLSDPDKCLLVPMNSPATNYCKQDTPEKAVHRYDKHIILQILEHYKQPHVTLDDARCRLYLDVAEQNEVERLLVENGLFGQRFVTIEPSSNFEYTVNRKYPHDKWQIIVDALRKIIPVAQVGASSSPKLSGVVDLRGKTTFRTAAGVIGASSMLLSTEGGLVHAATAFDVPSLVIITGYQHPNMVAYPHNVNLWIHGDHGPCGLKRECPECLKHVLAHDPNEAIIEVKRKLDL